MLSLLHLSLLFAISLASLSRRNSVVTAAQDGNRQAPLFREHNSGSLASSPLPVIVWHGLGDTFDGDGIRMVTGLIETINPGTFVYTISLGADSDADRSASFLGNVTTQIEIVCDAIAAHPILATAPAIDAMGFSQGGQFLRGFVERCNRPPVRSLVTFGSQHNGITEFHSCDPTDWLCKGSMALLHLNTWTAFVQARLVPAQYYRKPSEYSSYLENSNYLADINNERQVKNKTYKANIERLSNFVMYMFDHDTTVIPRQTAWFYDVNDTLITPLRERQLYKEDWLGLRGLDRKGGLHFRSIAGSHMQIPAQVLNDTIVEFFGS